MATNLDQVEGTADEYVGGAKAGVGDAFGDSKTSLEGRYQELKGKAQDAYGRARERVDEWSHDERVERAREYADRGVAQARQAVQEQPVAVLAGGIALGFLIGFLAAGRR